MDKVTLTAWRYIRCDVRRVIKNTSEVGQPEVASIGFDPMWFETCYGRGEIREILNPPSAQEG
jgi:hypothetical protein